MFKLDLEKAVEPEIKLTTPLDHRKSKRVPEEHLLCLIVYAEVFDCVDHINCETFLKKWEYQTTLPAS